MEYKISIDYDDYFANSQVFKASRIEVIGDSIMFYTDKETIALIESKNIRYMLHYSKKGKVLEFFKYRTGILIGVLCLIFLIVMNSFRVSAIEFSGTYPINDEIETYINSQNQQILFFDFHKNNYQDLAKELRSVFNEYEWISISKKGSKLFVEIEPTTTKEISFDDEVSGDIIAKKSGMITEFAVFNGSSNLSVNTYVKEGDVLISGQAAKAKGYVLATVYEEKIIEIPKINTLNEYTGKTINYNQITFFNKSFNIRKIENYDTSDLVIKSVFNIPYIISVNKIEEYEKNDIIYTYDKKSAITYAASIIEDEFTKSKILNEEKILRLESLVVLEDSDSFKITFLIKKIESIGEFKKSI